MSVHVDYTVGQGWLNRLAAFTTRLVDTVTTPTLLKLFAAGGIQAKDLITHGKPQKNEVDAEAMLTHGSQSMNSQRWKMHIPPLEQLLNIQH